MPDLHVDFDFGDSNDFSMVTISMTRQRISAVISYTYLPCEEVLASTKMSVENMFEQVAQYLKNVCFNHVFLF